MSPCGEHSNRPAPAPRRFNNVLAARRRGWGGRLAEGFHAALGLSLGVLAGCGTAKPPVAANAPAMVWPAPPEPARIAFVQSATQPADLGAKVGGFRRITDWIAGGDHGNERFVKPFGLTLDEADNLCVTDTADHSVSWYDRANKRWHRWERVGKIRFAAPVAVAKRGDTIFVADSGRAEVVAFSLKGDLRFRIKAGLTCPAGLVVWSDRLFVADSQRHQVRVFDLKGQPVAEFGQRGSGPGDLNFPTHLAGDDAGRLYVVDSLNSRVQVFSAAGKFLRQIGSAGDSPGHFSRPKGVAVDRHGHVFVLDALHDCLQIFSGESRLLLTLGQAGQGPGEFWLANGLAISRDNRIYVADSYNRRIQVFNCLGE